MQTQGSFALNFCRYSMYEYRNETFPAQNIPKSHFTSQTTTFVRNLVKMTDT